MSAKVMKELSLEEVAQHNKPDDLWIVVDSKVYDLSRFKDLHPGGVSVLTNTDIAGKEATEAFYGLHRHEVLERPQYARLQIGNIKGEKPQIISRPPGAISDVPYSEPTWLTQGFHSPYFTDNHRQFQKAMRQFIDEHVYEDAQARDADGKRPSQHVFDKMAELNLHAMRLGPGKHLEGRTLMGGLVKPEEFDYFHELIITQELVRCGSRVYGDALLGGKVIGLPPVLNFGKPELKAKVIPEVFSGKKFICLAISEPQAGSDVIGMTTTAIKVRKGAPIPKDGQEEEIPEGEEFDWIVNGGKKWITNGMFADYFTVGVKSESGLTVLLIPRVEGVETKPIKTSYGHAAGTALITFDNVRVPSANTLGEEGMGIFVILSNFNHERWVMCCGSARSQRVIIDECLRWVSQRKAFGKPLHSQAVVRSKIAGMIARTESVQAWLENITYQMTHMSYKEQSTKLAGQIAFLKTYSTKCAQDTARDAVQIFGGRGITQSGMGKFIEHYYRTVPFDSLLGGAEDVLSDLGVRQAIRQMPKNARL